MTKGRISNMAIGKPNIVKKAGSNGGGHISLRPSDQESGGLLDDVNAIVTECEATTWDYNGNADPGPALRIKLKTDDGSETEQYFSAGKLERIVPSEDGSQFDPAEGSSVKGLNNNCNAAVFLAELINKGFPEEKLESLQSIVGLYGHFNRVAQKKRTGLTMADENKQRTILICSKIHSLPWEKKGKATAGATSTAAAKPATNGKVAASGNGTSDLNDEAVAAVVSLLSTDGTIERSKLAMAVFKSIPKSPNRAAILKLVSTDEFVAQADMGWEFDGDNLTAA